MSKYVKKTKNEKMSKKFTYSTVIIEALHSYDGGKATSWEIFEYLQYHYPDIFRSSNETTWKSNIRQLLSKKQEFIKLEKDVKSRLHYWVYVPECTKSSECKGSGMMSEDMSKGSVRLSKWDECMKKSEDMRMKNEDVKKKNEDVSKWSECMSVWNEDVGMKNSNKSILLDTNINVLLDKSQTVLDNSTTTRNVTNENVFDTNENVFDTNENVIDTNENKLCDTSHICLYGISNVPSDSTTNMKGMSRRTNGNTQWCKDKHDMCCYTNDFYIVNGRSHYDQVYVDTRHNDPYFMVEYNYNINPTSNRLHPPYTYHTLLDIDNHIPQVYDWKPFTTDKNSIHLCMSDGTSTEQSVLGHDNLEVDTGSKECTTEDDSVHNERVQAILDKIDGSEGDNDMSC